MRNRKLQNKEGFHRVTSFRKCLLMSTNRARVRNAPTTCYVQSLEYSIRTTMIWVDCLYMNQQLTKKSDYNTITTHYKIPILKPLLEKTQKPTNNRALSYIVPCQPMERNGRGRLCLLRASRLTDWQVHTLRQYAQHNNKNTRKP